MLIRIKVSDVFNSQTLIIKDKQILYKLIARNIEELRIGTLSRVVVAHAFNPSTREAESGGYL